MKTLYNLLSASVVLFYILPLIAYAWTKDLFYLKAFTGYVCTTLLSEGIKHKVIRGEGHYAQRPAGATDCNLWCNNGPQGGRPGMPSSHSAEVAYLAAVYGRHASSPWITVAWVVYALAVMFSRYAKECHTLPQIIAGTFVGLFGGWFTMRFV